MDKNGTSFVQGEDVQAEAKTVVKSKLKYPPLPEEPGHTDGTVCRVAIRFPDGNRGQRKFLRADPIQVYFFCLRFVFFSLL